MKVVMVLLVLVAAAAARPQFFPGFGSGTAGGAGSGSIGPFGQTNAGALSSAHTNGGVAFGQSLGLAVNLPAFGIQQTFGQGGGFASGR